MVSTEALSQVPDLNSNGPIRSATAIAVDSNNAVHYAFLSGGEPFYAEKGSSGWVITDPDLAKFMNTQYLTYDVLIAAASSGGSNVVYLALSYDLSLASTAPPQARFGTKTGTQWSFEDLPAVPEALAVESTGTPILLTKDEVLRRNGTGWTHISVPVTSTGTLGGIATDAAGAWYVVGVAGTEVRASRRDPAGTWVTEKVAATSATDAQIAFAAGTVHVSYEAGGKLHYARRLGKAWSDQAVTNLVAQHAMTIDACGSPHFAVWTGVGTSTSEGYHTQYHRWTSAGWRSGDFGQSSCAFGDGVDIALTATAAKLSYYDCLFTLSSVPLK
jgi:hypothetical protein